MATEQSIYHDCARAVAKAIGQLGLRLDGGERPAVLLRKLPAEIDVEGGVPCVIVSYADRAESVEPFTFNGGVQAVYPVTVTLIMPALLSTSENLRTIPAWREQIRRLFQILGAPLPGNQGKVALPKTVWDTNVEMGPPYNAEEWAKNDRDVTLLTVKLTSAENATNAA
jgi:hypothetical protein